MQDPKYQCHYCSRWGGAIAALDALAYIDNLMVKSMSSIELEELLAEQQNLALLFCGSMQLIVSLGKRTHRHG